MTVARANKFTVSESAKKAVALQQCLMQMVGRTTDASFLGEENEI